MLRLTPRLAPSGLFCVFLLSCNASPDKLEVLASYDVLMPDGERVGQSVLARPRGEPKGALFEDLDVTMDKTRARMHVSLLRKGPNTISYQARRTINRQVDDVSIELSQEKLRWSQRRGLAIKELTAPPHNLVLLENVVPFGQSTGGSLACWWDLLQHSALPDATGVQLNVLAARTGRELTLDLSLRERAEVLVDGHKRTALRLFARTATTGQTLWIDARDRSLLALQLPGGGLARRLGVELPSPATISRPAKLREQPISLDLDGAHLAGLLSLPEQTPAPGLLIVHGSGPIDRDGGVLGIYRDLAWELGQAGIAVLRYDKRGVGESTQTHDVPRTLEVLRSDAAAMLEVLSQHPAVDPRCLFALGHSEGGYIVPALGQEKTHLAGVVLLAGSAQSLDKVMVEQLRLILNSAGAGQEEIDLALKQQAALFKLLRAGRNRKQAPLFNNNQAAWLRSHFDHEPGPVLMAQPAPVLALFGSLDLQVPATQAELQALHAARAERPLQIEVLDDLDHLFMHAKGSAGLGHYPDPDRHMAPEVVRHIMAWMRTQPCVAKGLQ